MAGKKVIMFLGSVRGGRMADRVAKLVQKELQKQQFQVTVFDPLEMNFPMLQTPLHFMPDRSVASKLLLDSDQKLRETDAFVVISPEYNCGIPPPLSNMLDHFPPDSFRHRPVAVTTYSLGNFGGSRAGVVLRPFLSELGMVGIPAYLSIPAVAQSVSEDGSSNNETVTANCTRVMGELKWYADALADQLQKKGGPNK